jgi:D-glycero-D-manno-heptose 1,7-bisphosphate phosphatase
MDRAVFLDRDGVINRVRVVNGRPYPPPSLDQFEILPGVPQAIQAFRRAGFRVLVATNQPDVATGRQTLAVVEAMHDYIRSQLAVDAIYVCYHTDAHGCACRKPKPGMFAASRGGVVPGPGAFVHGRRPLARRGSGAPGRLQDLLGPGGRVRRAEAPPAALDRRIVAGGQPDHLRGGGGMTWFFIYLPVHLVFYALVARQLRWFRREMGILLYHAVPATVAAVLALGFFLAQPGYETFCQAAVVISLQGIYSMSFLELWSLTQGGYSLTILHSVQSAGGDASADSLAALGQIGTGKQTDRLGGLCRLRLACYQGDTFTLTRFGRVSAFFLWCLARLVNHKTLG